MLPEATLSDGAFVDLEVEFLSRRVSRGGDRPVRTLTVGCAGDTHPLVLAGDDSYPWLRTGERYAVVDALVCDPVRPRPKSLFVCTDCDERMHVGCLSANFADPVRDAIRETGPVATLIALSETRVEPLSEAWTPREPRESEFPSRYVCPSCDRVAAAPVLG
ncbi:hypothetical protein [Natronomonas sp. EA1]|uniref:hypothetical protein n=1 Tax=Natronomonas sp. EA1 TaxID=3421655 RepID=UPI003EBEFB54